ncbi:GerMN domain-containing protein [Deltaproteobacteria bacterium IMCC39524]|nr:GerMN domain-containing protein [Deltaproteobacteria bacterium IMCC39524]
MPKSNYEPNNSKKRSYRKHLILWGALAVLVFVVGLVVGYLKTAEAPQAPPSELETSLVTTREVILYFASVDGQALVAETRDIAECQQDEDCLRSTVRALIAGSQGEFAAILPAQVVLNDVSVEGSLVNVDFSQELISAHPGGTQSELLTIYGLADTLAVNFPHLRQVRVLVDGAPIATLKGHVDLRQPINPDFSLVEEGMAPVGGILSLPAGGNE